jgi:hypothetical protein
MRVIDPLGVEWEVSVRRAGIERGELGWRIRGARRARRAQADVTSAFERGERSFSPAGAERVLPVSPLSSHEQRNVRVLP